MILPERLALYAKTVLLGLMLLGVVAGAIWWFGGRRFKAGQIEGKVEEHSHVERAEIQQKATEGDGTWLYRDILRRSQERP